MSAATCTESSLDFKEGLFSQAAAGTYPSRAQFVKRDSRRDSSIRVAIFRVVYPSTGIAFVFFHGIKNLVKLTAQSLLYVIAGLS